MFTNDAVYLGLMWIANGSPWAVALQLLRVARVDVHVAVNDSFACVTHRWA